MLVLASALFLTAILYWPREGSHQPAASSKSQDRSLSLKLEKRSSKLTLTWNRNAQAIREADYGTLMISDGPVRQELHISKGELINGLVNYSPRTDDIIFQLRVVGPRSPETETIRWLSAQ